MMKARTLSLALLFVIAGCGDDSGTAPPPQAMAPRDTAPTKIPTTKEEKIEAINKAPMSEDQKKAAIEKVNSGSL
ncbi:hypothetical protein EON81_17660 [bacterium]|nr:MAG: hypothetical protein EON81_17660 [bacterium]